MTLAAVALLTAASAAIGSATLWRVLWPDWRAYERLALELTAGLGLTALLLAALALAGLFPYAPLVLAAVSLAGVARAVGRRSRRTPSIAAPSPSSTPAQRPISLVAAAVALTMVLAALGAVAPITDDDALAFGIPCARHIAETGSLQVWPDQARAMLPQSQMLLLAFVLRMGGDRLGLVTALQWLLCIGVMSALARRVCERSDHVATAVVIALGSPVVAFQVASGKEDLLALATALGAACLLAGEGTAGRLAAAGMFAGLAAGAKYSGVGVAIAAVAWTAIAARGTRWRSSAIVAGAALACGGVWYALNWWRFGNPMAPFVFGAAGTHFDAQLVADFESLFGAGRGPLAFLIAPFRIFVQPSLFAGRGNLYNALAYAGLAGLLIASVRRRQGVLFFTAAILYVGWFFSVQNARLLLPAAALLAPSAADRLVPLVRRYRLLRPAAVVAVVLSLGVVAGVGVLRLQRYLRDPATYLDRESQRYADIRWMNENLDAARHRVASSVKVIGYLEVPSLVLDPTRQLAISPSDFDTQASLVAALRREHVTHVFGAPEDFAGIRPHLRVVYENRASRLGGVRFFREPPTQATAVFELID
jgi:hypothetical protein